MRNNGKQVSVSSFQTAVILWQWLMEDGSMEIVRSRFWKALNGGTQ